MRIFVGVKTHAKGERVEELDPTHFTVAVKASPVDGKANSAVVKALAKHLDIPQSRLTLRSGATSKRKVFEIL